MIEKALLVKLGMILPSVGAKLFHVTLKGLPSFDGMVAISPNRIRIIESSGKFVYSIKRKDIYSIDLVHNKCIVVFAYSQYAGSKSITSCISFDLPLC